MIIGAGMAGLIAGHLLPNHEIFERSPSHEENAHSALLRFRSQAVAEATGIEFRCVTVHKGIWLDDDWRAPTIDVANMYSRKVVGRLVDRSIWDISSAQRWIAPDDFYHRLVDGVGTRLHWDSPVDLAEHVADAVISTIPMPAALSALKGSEHPVFSWAPIFVKRFLVLGADVHQTVYFPTAHHTLYRASLSSGTLTCEFTGEPDDDDWERDVLAAFRLDRGEMLITNALGGTVGQEFGKIVPIDEVQRKRIVLNMTTAHGIFSLGRFATWRNIMLDDVVHDALVIKRLIAVTDYERKMYY